MYRIALKFHSFFHDIASIYSFTCPAKGMVAAQLCPAEIGGDMCISIQAVICLHLESIKRKSEMFICFSPVIASTIVDSKL